MLIPRVSRYNRANMGTYTYIARDSNGRRVSGQLVGASHSAVLNELQDRALSPLRIEEVKQRTSLRRRIGLRHLATFYRQLADLQRAGVPLLRALKLLGRGKSNPRLAEEVKAVADDVADGSGFADAMRARGEIFPGVHIAMVRAGERGGFLEQVLARMGAFIERQAEMRSKVIGNLIYPTLLLTVCVVILVVALVFFVPQFEEFYSDMDTPLPTKIVLAASALITDYWLWAISTIVLLIVGGWWSLRRPAARRAVSAWQLRLPKVGALIRDIAVARFTRILGTLLENGVPMIQAMKISRDAAGHMLLAESIDEATEAVQSGESLANPLARSGMFSDEVIEMISVGESANNLAEVLITAADTIETRIERTLNVFVRLMEPALLLLLGGAVMFMFLSLVVPMMKMSQTLS